MNLAPIILFVYNRPSYTKLAVEALQRNTLAKDSELFIFSDAAKDKNDIFVSEVREYIKTISGFNKISIIERENNFGLAANIIDGVTSIVNSYGKVIVLEDDIITSPYFLNYMNDALNVYENIEKVMHISAWSFPAFTEQNGETFLWGLMNCWGWGTWSRAWKYFDKNPKKLIETFSDEDIFRFNLDGCISDRWRQVVDNYFGRLNTWAIFWDATIAKLNGLCLNPKYPLVKNIGYGIEATHTKSKVDFLNTDIDCSSEFTFPKDIVEDKEIRKIIAEYWLAMYPKSKTMSLDYYGYLLAKTTPRFTKLELKLFDKKVIAPDSASLLFLVKELFEFEIYRFKSDTKEPLIIDCGANIGFSSIYFKRLYPDAKIIAFEPDPYIFSYLEHNIASFGFERVELINKALWSSETELEFYSEGADGGRIKELGDNEQIIKIKTERLSKYLMQKVSFLKLDIEGAEYEVLHECRELLGNVQNIFVEYHSFADKKQELSGILKILENAGFRYYIEHIGVKSHHPFIGISNYVGFDNQLNIFGYRE